MPHFGTLRDYRFKPEADDVRGANLYGVNDEKLGEIEDVVFDHSDGQIRYVVVDTGGWLSSKKFLLPADRIHPYEKDRDHFQVDLVKEHVERFPRYDEKMLESEKDWDDYEKDYRESWTAMPVQHKKGSNRDITPEPDEMLSRGRMSGEVGGPDTMHIGEDPGHVSEDVTPQRLAGKFPETAPTASKTTMRPAGTVARAEDAARTTAGMREGRWGRFEEAMRRNRQDIISRCGHCSPGGRRVA